MRPAYLTLVAFLALWPTLSPCATPADTIPITFSQGRILLPVEVGGQSHRFVFDTGCSCGLLFTDRALPLKSGGLFSFALVSDAAGHVKLTRRKRIADLRIGGMTLKRYPVIVSPPSSMMRQEYDCQGIVGCIGSDLFDKRGQAVKIDVRAGRMVVSSDPSLFAHEEGFRIPFDTDLHVPYVNVKTRADKERRYMFDTGFPGIITVRAKDLLDIDTLDTAVGATNAGIYGRSRLQSIAKIHLDSLSIGGCVFRDITTNVQSSNTSSIGSLLLKYGTVVIDYKHHTLIYQPYAYDHGITIGNQYHHVVLMYDGGSYKVTLVWEDTDAWRRGIRPGDRLTHIDGINIEDTPCAYMNLDMSQDHTLTLVSESGEEKELSIHRIKKEERRPIER